MVTMATTKNMVREVVVEQGNYKKPVENGIYIRESMHEEALGGMSDLIVESSDWSLFLCKAATPKTKQ